MGIRDPICAEPILLLPQLGFFGEVFQIYQILADSNHLSGFIHFILHGAHTGHKVLNRDEVLGVWFSQKISFYQSNFM